MDPHGPQPRRGFQPRVGIDDHRPLPQRQTGRPEPPHLGFETDVLDRRRDGPHRRPRRPPAGEGGQPGLPAPRPPPPVPPPVDPPPPETPPPIGKRAGAPQPPP